MNVFIDSGEIMEGLARKVLEKIHRSRKRGISILELSWLTGADMFLIFDALRKLSKAHLISVRVRYAVHWCYPLREVA
jgi:hypothetical protein